MNYEEAAGLRMEWLNPTGQIVTHKNRTLPPFWLAVEETFNRGHWGGPKAKFRRRILPLSQGLVDALRALVKAAQPTDAVFGVGNRPIDYSVSLRVLKAAGRQAGIGWVNWHGLRRFFANISDHLGIPLTDRQYIMGHTYARMTQHYTTVPEIERKRPYVTQITRALLDPDVTMTLPTLSEPIV